MDTYEDLLIWWKNFPKDHFLEGVPEQVDRFMLYLKHAVNQNCVQILTYSGHLGFIHIKLKVNTWEMEMELKNNHLMVTKKLYGVYRPEDMAGMLLGFLGSK